ncbi:hypothetical protein L2E82_00322 [Cichorium intybus]|uniref:Uncharacterized protein n=1 Tax=Cichorium intybus TaxID=13427 RepID=A0ACB9GXN7_CICIN|nr:hypothetical protein L2E82_00322 [Cichorium intybus]
MASSKNLRSLLFYIVFLSLLPLKITSTSETQAEALIRWKRTLSSSSSSSDAFLNSWSSTNIKNMCNWTGIVCNEGGTVSKITLQNSSLSGTLTEFEFSSFPNLTHLDLSNNNVGGSIPSAISNLTSIMFLDLSSNGFKDEIPSEIGKLTHLEYLDLNDNNLNGNILFRIGNLQNNLTFLDLSKNHLNGTLPESFFTNLHNLEYLNLTENSFQGPLSTGFYNLSNLKDLRLGDC